MCCWKIGFEKRILMNTRIKDVEGDSRHTANVTIEDKLLIVSLMRKILPCLAPGPGYYRNPRY